MKLHIVFACCVVLLFGGFYASSSLTTIQASDLSVRLAQVDPLEFESDDFNDEELNTDVWEFIQPSVGPISPTLSFDGTNALIELPEGTEFESWVTGHNAPRLMQETDAQEFEVEVKFDSIPQTAISAQGIVVELNDGGSDRDRFVRFEFFYNNNTLFAYIAELRPTGTDGYETVFTPILENIDNAFTGAPMYMRVSLTTENVYTMEYSTDGQNYTEVDNFSRPNAVTHIGVYAANPEPDSGPAPNYISSIDYFRNMADPNFIDDPEPTPTPTEEPTETPTATPDPVDPTPTATPDPVDPTPTATPDPVDPTPTATPDPVDPSAGVFLPLIIR